MKTQGRGWLRRIAAAAAAGAMALGLAGLTVPGLAASADTTVPVTGVGNIDPDTPTSLTIHKYSGLEASTPDDGALNDSIDTSTHTPLDGVQFTITPVTEKGGQAINLDTPEGWDLIKGVTADQVKASDSTFALGTAQTVETANGGVATASLPHGLYLVQEGDDNGNNDIVSKTADFLVTLPLPQVASDGTTNGNWIYDVNVYPKNQILAGPEKTINKTEDQTGVKVGDTVQYTITQTVPALNAGETYTQAVIYDNLTPDELAYDSTASLTNSGTALTADDYTINSDATTGALNWTLTDSGLGKIKAGDTITVVFTAKVLKVTTTGEVANQPGNGEVGTPGYGSTFNGKTVPGVPTPYSYWGQLEVTKVVQGNESQMLKDAEFAVSETGTDGKCSPTAPSASDAVATGTSDSDGVVQWNSTPTSPLGLFVANSNDGPLTNPSKGYCLYETKAPAGYVLTTAPQQVTITPGTTNVNKVTFKDPQQNHPNLPLTGATGGIVMVLGGLALVAIGVGAYLVLRRRSAH